MMSRAALEMRFERIDLLLETISSCETHLDPLLLVRETAEDIPVSVMPPPSSESTAARSESELADEVAARIRQARTQRGWRQKDLAEATGIARPNIARLESGRRMPKVSTLHKISGALGIPVETLLGT